MFSTDTSGSFHLQVSSVLSDGSSDHPKTHCSSSGVSSDLSDSENEHHDHDLTLDLKDKDHHHHHQGHGTKGHRSMSESGIFDASNSPSPSSMTKSILAEIGTQTQLSEDLLTLNHKIERLKVNPVVATSGVTLAKMAEYDSCEELDDLRGECRQLVSRKNCLEDEIEGYKGEIKTLKTKVESYESDKKITELERIEYSLRNQLKEWEKKYNSIYEENQSLLEEKCELEEADNDSRVNAQRSANRT